MAKLLALHCITILIIINFVSAGRVKDMIYMSLDNVSACFRRHNGTHQFGCSSSRSGSVGVVHFVEVENDVRWLETNATAGPYMVVMPFSMFRKDILIRLRNTNNIHGVLLARNTSMERPDFYSPEDTCPNRYSGDKQCDEPWNPFGSVLLLEDWPFPMFYMQNQTLLEAIRDCFRTHNAHHLEKQSERSLCALEMKSFMFAALNSESCIRRSRPKFNMNLYLNHMQFCDPLGDRNIHWPLVPLRGNSTNSVIMVTTRLDSSSLFDEISPGAQSAITGLVTLLAAAQYLNTMNVTVNDTNVVFSFFNGEAFDYIGSSRMVYDIKKGNFMALGGVKLQLEEIRAIIELSQINEGDVFLHTKNAENLEITKQLKDRLAATVLKDNIPPASAQSFLKEKSDIPVIVLANHGKTYTNKYYHSVLDDLHNVNFNRNATNNGLVTSITKIATSLAEILYTHVTGKLPIVDKSEIQELVSEMLFCYLDSARCNLFRAASYPGAKLIDHTFPLYVGVHRVQNPATSLTGQLLALLTGEKLPDMNEATCHKKHLSWMGGYNFTGLCINSTVNYSSAISPAFVIEGYDMQSGVYSTWTESIWEMLSMRMFLKPSATAERFSMILGSGIAGISFILVWFINSRADIIFNSRTTDC